MATKSKQIKVSSFSDGFMGNANRSQISQHPHSRLPKDKLQLIKIRNKCICIIDGLPKDITIDQLKSPEWYGGFRKIIKIDIKQPKKSLKEEDNANVTAYITFHNQRPRDDAIEYTNNLYFEDGRILKATHGYNYYCKSFINNKKCTKKNCQDIHQWVYDTKEDVISRNAWSYYLSRPCGILPDVSLNYVPRKNVGNNMFESGSRKNTRNKVKRSGDKCHKCGGIGHWARDCARINSYFNDKFMSNKNENQNGNASKSANLTKGELDVHRFEDKEQLLLQDLNDMKYEYGMLLEKYEDILLRKHATDEKIDKLQEIEQENKSLKSEIVKYQQAGINPINNEMKKKMIMEVHNMRQQMTELQQTNEKLRNSVQQLSINNENMKQENEALRKLHQQKQSPKHVQTVTQSMKMENKAAEGKDGNGKKRRKRKRRRSKEQNDLNHDLIQEQPQNANQNQNALTAKIADLESDNKKKEAEVEEWKAKCGLLMRQRSDLNGQLNTLQDDFKELEIRYNELESKCNETKKSDWRTWDAMDIVNWIINLDGQRYGKYTDRLSMSLVKEEIDGECLKDMDKNDLHRLGITAFKDKRDVFEKLQELTQNMMTNDGFNNVYNEGKITPIV